MKNVTLSLFSFVFLLILVVSPCASYDFSVYKKVSGSLNIFVITVQFPSNLASIEISTIEKRVFYEMMGYYQNVSYGKVILTGNISKTWITLSCNMSYYGDYDNTNDHSAGARALIEDAVKSIDEFTDFSKFDFVFVVHAGKDEANSQHVTDIWSWGFWEGLFVQTNDGVLFDQGAVVSEFNSLGIFCHEFGHVIGLPDLYNYDRESSERFVENWGLMGHGCYNGVPQGSKPSHILSWGKIFLGWIDDTGIFEATLEQSENVTVQPLKELSAGIKTIKVRITNETYYLVEVRTDDNLPDQGVLITFVDETKNSGMGILRVIDSHSPTSTLYDAVFHEGDIFEETQHHFTIKVLERFENGSYSVRISNKLLLYVDVLLTDLIEAYDDLKIEVRVTNFDATPLQGLTVALYINEESRENLQTDENGIVILSINFDLFMIGKKSVKIHVNGGSHYLDSLVERTVNVTFPSSLFITIILSILGLIPLFLAIVWYFKTPKIRMEYSDTAVFPSLWSPTGRRYNAALLVINQGNEIEIIRIRVLVDRQREVGIYSGDWEVGTALLEARYRPLHFRGKEFSIYETDVYSTVDRHMEDAFPIVEPRTQQRSPQTLEKYFVVSCRYRRVHGFFEVLGFRPRTKDYILRF